MNNIDLAGRVALVTGAARGLGLHIATELARAGMMIAGMDTRSDELETALEDLQNRCAVTTLPLHADVTSENDVINAVGQTVVNQWGQTRLICMDSCLRRNGMD